MGSLAPWAFQKDKGAESLYRDRPPVFIAGAA